MGEKMKDPLCQYEEINPGPFSFLKPKEKNSAITLSG
jgi:hypothetical protein